MGKVALIRFNLAVISAVFLYFYPAVDAGFPHVVVNVGHPRFAVVGHLVARQDVAFHNAPFRAFALSVVDYYVSVIFFALRMPDSGTSYQPITRPYSPHTAQTLH